MNDAELDEILNTWKVPEAPESMRAGLRSRLPARRRAAPFGIRPRWIAALAAATTLAVGASLVTDGTIASESGPWETGVYIRRTRIVHPYLAKFVWWDKAGVGTGWQRQGNGRAGSVYLLDKSSRVHYGYTWQAEPLGGGRYRFSVSPLSPAVLREEGPITPLARPMPPMIVGPGSAFDVDIYVSKSQRLYDRYEVSAKPLPPPRLDNPDYLTLTNPQLYINGAQVLGSGGGTEFSGALVSVQLRHRGEYMLTLLPRGDPRFPLAGSAKGNTIEFRAGGEDFRIVCTAPVARSGERAVYGFFKKDSSLGVSGFGGGGSTAPIPGGPGR